MKKTLSELFVAGGYLGLCGPYAVGKDWVVQNLNESSDDRVRVVRVAGPLYRLAESLHGAKIDKAWPGARQLLQRLGAWGRGDITPEHPLTVERLAVSHWVRASGTDWAEFGTHPDFWVSFWSREISRIQWNAPDSMCVCPDARFPNELREGARIGKNYAVLALPETVLSRRAALGYPDRASDPSEEIATTMLVALYSEGLLKAALRKYGFSGIIWNDSRTAPGAVLSLVESTEFDYVEVV